MTSIPNSETPRDVGTGGRAPVRDVGRVAGLAAPAAPASGGLNRPFGVLLSAASLSNVADGIGQTVFPLLVAALTRDPLLVAGLSAAQRLPWLLFALPIGAYVDRTDRRRAMVIVGFARTGMMALLALAILTRLESVPVLYAIAFLLGVADTVYDTAAAAVIPAVIGQESGRLATANGRLFAIQSIAQQFVGPPLGGYLFAVALMLPFGLTGVSFAASALLVLALPGSFRPHGSVADAPDRRRLSEDIAHGVSWVWHDPLLRSFSIMVAVLGFCNAGVSATLVVFARRALDLGGPGFGLLISANGVGAIIGSLSAPAVSRRTGPGGSLLLSVLAATASYLGMAMLSAPLAVAALFAANGWSVMLWGVVHVATRQVLIPDRMLGRAMSVHRLMAWGTMPLGAVVGGLAARLDVRLPLLAGGLTYSFLAIYVARKASNRRIEEARVRLAEPGTIRETGYGPTQHDEGRHP